eukprot:PhF_6_TR30384/c0_g1_i1/m.44536
MKKSTAKRSDSPPAEDPMKDVHVVVPSKVGAVTKTSSSSPAIVDAFVAHFQTLNVGEQEEILRKLSSVSKSHSPSSHTPSVSRSLSCLYGYRLPLGVIIHSDKVDPKTVRPTSSLCVVKAGRAEEQSPYQRIFKNEVFPIYKGLELSDAATLAREENVVRDVTSDVDTFCTTLRTATNPAQKIRMIQDMLFIIPGFTDCEQSVIGSLGVRVGGIPPTSSILHKHGGHVAVGKTKTTAQKTKVTEEEEVMTMSEFWKKLMLGDNVSASIGPTEYVVMTERSVSEMAHAFRSTTPTDNALFHDTRKGLLYYFDIAGRCELEEYLMSEMKALEASGKGGNSMLTITTMHGSATWPLKSLLKEMQVQFNAFNSLGGAKAKEKMEREARFRFSADLTRDNFDNFPLPRLYAIPKQFLQSCRELVEVNMVGVTKVHTIDDHAFSCQPCLRTFHFHVTVPPKTTFRIGDRVLEDCLQLKTISIQSNHDMKIGSRFGCGCPKVEHVEAKVGEKHAVELDSMFLALLTSQGEAAPETVVQLSGGTVNVGSTTNKFLGGRTVATNTVSASHHVYRIKKV